MFNKSRGLSLALLLHRHSDKIHDHSLRCLEETQILALNRELDLRAGIGNSSELMHTR